MPILTDRKLNFSESKKDEWKILLEKVRDGVELPDPDCERWFSAKLQDKGITISSAEKNVRPLKIHDPVFIEFEEFKNVAEIYNELLFPNIGTLSPKLELQKSSPNLKYVFNLIYNFL